MAALSSRTPASIAALAPRDKPVKAMQFKSTISRGVKVTEAPGYGKPVYYYDKNAKGSKEYLDVARELAERM